MKYSILILLSLLFFNGVFTQNNVCFTIEANPNPSDPALSVFSKYIDVFGCGIYAESTVSDAKVLHVAAVWAELIDNDEDGIVDDPDLLNELVLNEALMPIFETDGNAAMTTFENNYSGDGVSAVLWATEIDPTQTGHWGDDASVEEILHTINAIGHVNIYSSAFELGANSSLLSAAMDSARGGQWLSIPSPYPSGAWYHYDDNTCDYECMAIEYIYWMIVSNMGILDDVSTCSGIANECEPCSAALLQSTDALGYALITDPTYKLPQLAPDGNYCPPGLNVKENPQYQFQIYPDPTTNLAQIVQNQADQLALTIRNQVGQIVKTKQLTQVATTIDISHLSTGIYMIQVGNYIQKLVVQ